MRRIFDAPDDRVQAGDSPLANLSTRLAGWGQTALDFLFPAECVTCHEFLGDQRHALFCHACWQTIAAIPPPLCPRCGTPFTSPTVLRHAPNFLCGECRQSPPAFDRLIATAYYEGVLKEAIHLFKFQRKPRLSRELAQLMLTQMPADLDLTRCQSILPVPLHRRRQQQRGYNQAGLLAQHLAQHYRLTYRPDVLTRDRDTPSQALLKGRRARRANVKNAFRVAAPAHIQAQHLILVDDVMTTGATVNECAKTLKRAGAASVIVLALSRAAGRAAHRRP